MLVDQYDALNQVFVAIQKGDRGDILKVYGVFSSKKEAEKCSANSTDIVAIFMDELNDECIANQIKILLILSSRDGF